MQEYYFLIRRMIKQHEVLHPDPAALALLMNEISDMNFSLLLYFIKEVQASHHVASMDPRARSPVRTLCLYLLLSCSLIIPKARVGMIP